jgi:hypothetical protein
MANTHFTCVSAITEPTHLTFYLFVVLQGKENGTS